ncbi:unnamed protein product [Lymnaea stagnalis]|uniref:DUF19 domain-containing protein n=1 Tax=Lymnaea stagnalis TaxID=6523 RepID=A0AAV2IAW8_LYMST
MKMFKLILALSCVVIVCECNILRSNETCGPLERCNMPLDYLEIFYMEGIYEQFCQAEADYKHCNEELKPQCNNEDLTEEIESTLAAVKFICSNEGSQVLHAAAHSDCITNATKKSEMFTTIRDCEISALSNAFLNHLPFEDEVVCPLIERDLTCVTNYIDENCGAIYGAFLHEFVRRKLRPSLGCELVQRQFLTPDQQNHCH